MFLNSSVTRNFPCLFLATPSEINKRPWAIKAGLIKVPPTILLLHNEKVRRRRGEYSRPVQVSTSRYEIQYLDTRYSIQMQDTVSCICIQILSLEIIIKVSDLDTFSRAESISKVSIYKKQPLDTVSRYKKQYLDTVSRYKILYLDARYSIQIQDTVSLLCIQILDTFYRKVS